MAFQSESRKLRSKETMVPADWAAVMDFVGDFCRRRRERGEDAAGVDGACAVFGAEDGFSSPSRRAWTWLMAVCGRGLDVPEAARMPKPRSVKLRPLRTVRPTPS